MESSEVTTPLAQAAPSVYVPPTVSVFEVVPPAIEKPVAFGVSVRPLNLLACRLPVEGFTFTLALYFASAAAPLVGEAFCVSMTG